MSVRSTLLRRPERQRDPSDPLAEPVRFVDQRLGATPML